MDTLRAFSIGDILRKAWRKFKDQPLTWVGALLLMFLISLSHLVLVNRLTGHDNFYGINTFSFIKKGQVNRHPPSEERELELSHATKNKLALLTVIYTLIQSGLGLGLFYMSVRAVKDQPLHIGHLFTRFGYLFHYFFGQILFAFILLAGFLLLFFPAMIWAARYGLFPFFIADQKVGPIKALKMSAEATYGAKWDMFAFYLVSFWLALAGLLTFGLGLLVVVPVVHLAWAYAYRQLVYPPVSIVETREPSLLPPTSETELMNH